MYKVGHKKFFKRRNLFLVSFLAVAGIFSATAIIKDKQVEEAPVTEKAEAADSTFYIIGNLGYAGNDGGANWNKVNLKKLADKDSQGRDQWAITPVYIAANAEFKFKKGDTWLNVWKDGSFSNFDEGGYGNWKCTSAGWYNVYYKDNGLTNSNVYIGSASAPSTKSITFNYSGAASAIKTGQQYIYYCGADGTPATSWPGLKVTISSNVVTYSVPSTATVVIMNNNSKQTMDIDGDYLTNGKTIYIWSDVDASSHYLVSSYQNKGAYLAGDCNSWTWTYSSERSWTNQSFDADDRFKIIIVSTTYREGYWINWGNTVAGNAKSTISEGSDSAYKVELAGSYDISYSSSTAINGTITINDTADSGLTTGYYLVGNAQFLSDIGNAEGDPYKLNSGLKMGSGSGTDLAKTEHLALSAGAVFYVRYYNATTGNDAKLASTLGTNAGDFVTISNNMVTVSANKGGPFTLGVNSSSQLYVLPDAYPVTAYASFYSGSSSVATNVNITSSLGSNYKYGRYQMDYYPEPFGDGYDYNTKHYTLEGWYSDSGLTNKITVINNVTSNKTIYAKFSDATYYTITYKFVLNGIYMEDWGTGTIKGLVNTSYASLASPSVYGMDFEGFYSGYDSTNKKCTGALGNTNVTGNATVYAKFSSKSTNKTLYVAFDNSKLPFLAGGDGITYMWYQKADGTNATSVPALKVSGVTATNLYQLSIPSDAAWFLIHGGLSNGSTREGYRSNSQTFTNAGQHNLYHINAYDSSGGQYTGTWKDCVYYFQVSSNSTFTSPTNTEMTESADPSSRNAAEAMNVSVTNNYYFRIQIVVGDVSTTNITKIGDNDETTDIATSGTPPHFTETTKANVYLNGDTIYLLDTATISKGGYLYLSSDVALSSLKLTVTFTSGASTAAPFSGAPLSDVRDIESTTRVTFDTYHNLIVIPIYNLRNNDTPTGSTYTVTFTDGSSSKTVNVPVSISTPLYYLKLFSGSLSDANADTAKAAKAVYDIDEAIHSATHASVCEISSDLAAALCEEYDAANNDALLTGASIYTWVSSVDGSEDYVGLPNIRIQLGNRAGGKYIVPAINSFNLSTIFGSENDASTIIIIVASSLSLLSITALSVLMVKKRKHKEY